MSDGFMGKILRVNLGTGTISDEEVPREKARKYMGGASLATKYLYDEVPAGVDPLGEDNKLIFMTGPLTGTASPSAARYSVVTKSPLTQVWGQANSGGSFGPALKKAGYDGIIFEGIAPSPVYLSITDGTAELKNADQLWGKKVAETEDILKEAMGNRTRVACIGPVGENLVRIAAIMNEKHRAATRCGVGAVMGSKKLKAIAVTGAISIDLHNKDEFKKVSKRQYELINESLLKIGLETFGTPMIADMVNVKGGYPTRNWQEGEFEEIDDVNAQAISDKLLEDRLSCFACPIACGRGTEIKEGKWKGNKGEGPEYEISVTFGAMCGVSDINAVTMANYHCNDYGLDTISAGSVIAFALECYEKGILTDSQTGGQKLKFGDGELVVDLVEKMAKREGIGDLLAEGSRIMSEKLGQNSEHFAT
jgi:aldehyde:ferredoxin oxidoreductase